MIFFSNSELYLKYASFQQKPRSISEVLLCNVTFKFFVCLIYTSFQEVLLKHTSIEIQGSEV